MRGWDSDNKINFEFLLCVPSLPLLLLRSDYEPTQRLRDRSDLPLDFRGSADFKGESGVAKDLSVHRLRD